MLRSRVLFGIEVLSVSPCRGLPGCRDRPVVLAEHVGSLASVHYARGRWLRAMIPYAESHGIGAARRPPAPQGSDFGGCANRCTTGRAAWPISLQTTLLLLSFVGATTCGGVLARCGVCASGIVGGPTLRPYLAVGSGGQRGTAAQRGLLFPCFYGAVETAPAPPEGSSLSSLRMTGVGPPLFMYRLLVRAPAPAQPP